MSETTTTETTTTETTEPAPVVTPVIVVNTPPIPSPESEPELTTESETIKLAREVGESRAEMNALRQQVSKLENAMRALAEAAAEPEPEVIPIPVPEPDAEPAAESAVRNPLLRLFHGK